LETVALKALADRQPASLSRGKGQAGFAANRRAPNGPLDHELPILVATGTNGHIRAIFASYACHGTTLGSEFNQICGDWPGYAQECLEKEFPGAVALIALACAGDANPKPRGSLDLARQHGAEFCSAVSSTLTNAMTSVLGKLVCAEKQIGLPLETL